MSLFVAVSGSGEIVGAIGCKTLGSGEGHIRGMAVRAIRFYERSGFQLSGKVSDFSRASYGQVGVTCCAAQAPPPCGSGVPLESLP